MLFGSFILLGLALWKKERLFKNKQSLKWAILAGICFCADLCFWHYGIGYIGPGLATILVNSQVFILAIIDTTVFKSRVTPQLLVAALIAATGFYFLIFFQWKSSSHEYLLGAGLSLIAAVFYSLYVCCLKTASRLENALSDVANILIISVSSTLIISFGAFYQDDFFIIPSLSDWTLLLTYGLIVQCLAWVLIFSGMAKAKLSLVGFILVLQPVFSFLWEILLFSWQRPWHQYLGAILLFIAMLCALQRQK